jgi:hypothetical protein
MHDNVNCQEDEMKNAVRNAPARLRWFFRRNGCIRMPNLERRRKDGLGYRKGYEVRLAASSRDELKEIRAALQTVGIRGGRAYPKGRQFVQPIYGADGVKWFSPGVLKKFRATQSSREKKTR